MVIWKNWQVLWRSHFHSSCPLLSIALASSSCFQEPVLFLKPTSSYLQNGGTIEVPHPWESLDHEVELAVVIGKKARDVSEGSAMDHVGGNL